MLAYLPRGEMGAFQGASGYFMNSNLFVGNFPYETTQEELSALFRTHGRVMSVKSLVDRETGRSRGIAFVEMSAEAEAAAAIAKLNGTTLGAREIFVSEARPREKKPDGPLGKPGFVERRSGKDRRQAHKGPGGGGFPRREEKPWEKRPPFGGGPKKKWGAKPGFAGKKPWEKRPSFGGPKKEWDRKPGFGPAKGQGFGEKKKWGPPGAGGPKKPWEKRPPFGGGPKKPWGSKPRPGGDKREGAGFKKKWTPGGPGGPKKWGAKPRRPGGS